MGVYFWALCSVPLIDVCIYASTMLFWSLQPCRIVLYQVVWFLQPCSSFSGPLLLCGAFCSIHTFEIFVLVLWNTSLESWQELHWIYRLLWAVWTFQCFLIPPIHDYSMCFHLFVSSSISFFCVLQFSEYRSFTSLVRLFLGILLFLKQLWMGLFSQVPFWLVHYWHIKMQLISEY